MQSNAHAENPLNPFSANASTKMRQFRAVARQFPLEFLHARVFPIRALAADQWGQAVVTGLFQTS